MKILILGYSNIVQRRVLPALDKILGVSQVEIASARSADKVALPERLRGQIYQDYDMALEKSGADVVYISTLNTLHAALAKKALLKGFHVIVDKPSVMNYDEARELIEIARRQKRCLAESTVYAYHPQIALMQDLFIQAKAEPSRITAIFSFPPRPAADYRYCKELGGGALLDVGPYAMTPGRLFFGCAPQEIFCRVTEEKNGADISFSVLALYEGGRSLVGHFGFNTEYWNYLNVFGLGLSVDSERVYSIPPNLENELCVKEKNQRRTLKAPAADCFVVFLEHFFASIKNGRNDVYLDDLLTDARVMEQLRRAAAKK